MSYCVEEKHNFVNKMNPKQFMCSWHEAEHSRNKFAKQLNLMMKFVVERKFCCHQYKNKTHIFNSHTTHDDTCNWSTADNNRKSYQTSIRYKSKLTFSSAADAKAPSNTSNALPRSLK